ncbi:hypothetical protein RFN25_26375 [Mesorhizobium abyssinicae]|uniref:hypothetical protein n=1 Tax=Mesorhizobium abyssinicae TaxID=1209958 RepID=UPI002A24AEFB|nr:hypothetical protein [Mesorhizobium abyssinicae]MDX8436957.1 hypothetical protein [Mesorhizobium abyssinicae]
MPAVHAARLARQGRELWKALSTLYAMAGTTRQLPMARSLTGGPQQSAVLDALMTAGRGSRLQQSQVDRVARALLLEGSDVVSRAGSLAVFVDPDKQNHASASHEAHRKIHSKQVEKPVGAPDRSRPRRRWLPPLQ